MAEIVFGSSFLGSLIGTGVGVGLGVVSRLLGKKPTSQPNITFGQPIADVYLTGSSEGAAVRKTWGRMRLGGNVIWCSNFKEWVETRVDWSLSASSGKGGGGGPTWTPSITIVYHANLSFAVAFCEGGPNVALGRVWADGKELDLAQCTWRFYNGSAQQSPDPFIETVEGVGNVPAYRGICYLVFENLVLDKFGNRMPQITAEIVRMPETDDADDLTNSLRSVCLIPGLGEFALGTQIYKASDSYGSTWVQNGNVDDQRADLLISLDQLAGANELPAVAPWVPPYNLPWGGNPDPPTGGNWASSKGALAQPDAVSLVVSWFGSDLRAGNCQIVPKVEVRTKNMSPNDWAVAGYYRSTAPLVSQIDSSLFDPSGIGGSVAFTGNLVPAFGGTPSDDTVRQAIQEIKRRGLRCVFYPFVMMDIPPDNGLADPYGGTEQAAFPWRGRITCHPAPGQPGTVDKTAAAATQIAAFFAQYRTMVLHYAQLCKDASVTAALTGYTPAMVDAFIIGSELVGLTSVRSTPGDGTFPAVDALRTLAADVRAILGPGVKIGYAANWDEYHSYRPADGSNDVIFNLDPLWADANIDFIGIDNYMPVADWRDYGSNVDGSGAGAPASNYDKDYIKANIEGGEYFDWYYASANDRVTQTRTSIVDASKGKHWVFRQKDMRSWWTNAHKSRPGGVENAGATVWSPGSKPIWFTEFGCPAIDKGANQPNVFVDPKSAESAMPYFSNGSRDDAIQRAYLEATLSYWRDNAPVVAGLKMVEPKNMFAWCWDARPFPDFPARNGAWRDGANYELGHWLTGRATQAPLKWIISELCAAVDLDDFDADGIVGPGSLVTGYASDGVVSPRDLISGIEDCYQFDSVETQGKIVFTSRAFTPETTIGSDEAVIEQEGDVGYELTRAQETDLPVAIKLSFLDAYSDYATSSVIARRALGTSNRVADAQFPVVLEPALARSLAIARLQQVWKARESGSIYLPPSRLAIDPGDRLAIPIEGVTRHVRVNSVDTTTFRALAFEGFDPSSATGQSIGADFDRRGMSTRGTYGAAIVEFLDIPVASVDDPKPWAPRIAAYASPWSGVTIYRASGSGFASLSPVASVQAPSIMGELTSPLYSGPRSRWDDGNAVYVLLYDRTAQLLSLDEADVLAGAGAIAVKNANSEWEILQYATATLIAPATYKLTRLLRGQQGTEAAMRDPVAAGARVVVLDPSKLAFLDMTADQRGQTQRLRYGPARYASSDPSYKEADFVFGAVGLRPWSPSQIEGVRTNAGDVSLSWARRTRFDGDSWEAGDVPLNEDAESYDLEILNGSSVVRTVAALTTPAFLYTAAMQTADFGSAQSSYTFRVYQNSAQIGRGQLASRTVYL